MILVIQRVTHASCTVNEKITGKINKGFMILVGVDINDTYVDVAKVSKKVAGLRVFNDENDKMNLSLKDVNGEILSISQFTLLADARHGNRPSFTNAKKGEEANALYEEFNKEMENYGYHVEKGVFGADMKIDLLNDGPVTIILNSKEL